MIDIVTRHASATSLQHAVERGDRDPERLVPIWPSPLVRATLLGRSGKGLPGARKAGQPRAAASRGERRVDAPEHDRTIRPERLTQAPIRGRPLESLTKPRIPNARTAIVASRSEPPNSWIAQPRSSIIVTQGCLVCLIPCPAPTQRLTMPYGWRFNVGSATRYTIRVPC
jgi:hypothetical protein